MTTAAGGAGHKPQSKPVPVSLEGCYERIERARSCLRRLEQAATDYLDSNTYSAALLPDQESGRATLRVELRQDVPTELWLLASEVAHHLRACLDHLVYQLATWNGANPDESRTQFPICVRADVYFRGKKAKGERASRLAGVADTHRRCIDRFQPFQQGMSASRTPLSRLNTFSIDDKHKVPQQAALLILGITVRMHQADGQIRDTYVPYGGAPRLFTADQRAVLSGGTYHVPFQFQVHGSPAMRISLVNLKLGVGLGKGALQTPDLRQILDEVEQIVQVFVPTL